MYKFNALKWLPISFLIVLGISLPLFTFAVSGYDLEWTNPYAWEIDLNWDVSKYLGAKGDFGPMAWPSMYGGIRPITFTTLNTWEPYRAYQWYVCDDNTFNNCGANYTIYFDENGFVVYPLKIYGSSPASGTTITDFESPSLSITYQGFDWDIYDGFVVNFRDDVIGVAAKSIQFLAEDLDPSGNGTEVINLADFEIDENGKWYLTALGFGADLDIQGGMFLTTRGYVDFWSDELVDPEYYLNINVAGLPTPYTFDEPETWYSENVLRFDSPTTFFTSFTDIFGPIFEKIAEFGNRILPMFNQTEAYDRGYALGEIFPIARGYISKIDMFFGGFPLASFLTYIILIMLGIFIFRIIMKFIPFLG